MCEKKLARLFNILGYLSPNSQITVDYLASQYNENKTTIKKDIETLFSAQMGIFCNEDKIQISKHGYKKIQSWLRS